MNRLPAILFVLLCLSLSGGARVIESFDAGWKFFRGDPANANQAALDDAGWRSVDLPHDWSIAGPFSKTNLTGGAGAFLPSGIAWYRKEFSLPTNTAGQCVTIEFDGVMHNSDVWINGHHLGHRPNGYVSFSYDLTPYLNFSGTNLIAVRCDTSEQPASRWYSGAGIYRHVRLVTAGRVHFAGDGVFIYAQDVTRQRAVVKVDYTLENNSDTPCGAEVQTILFAPDGKKLGSTGSFIVISNSTRLQQEIILTNPPLWDLAKPQLIRAVSKIRNPTTLPDTSLVTSKALDQVTNTFGIRSAEFTPDQGFVLNGRKVVLKGVCLHHDGGAFGAAVPLAIWEQRLNTLRGLGVNAIRTAHNPVAPEFLDLCDRMGFLVMDEFFDCWTVGKNPFDYHLYFNEWSARDAADTVKRDRNHPSVILYSIGNEIHDTPQPKIAIPIASNLVAICHANDPSRPVTQALFRPNVSGDYTNGLADLLDVVGTNYRDRELLAAQRAKPARKIIGTEQRHDRETWLNLRDHSSHAGQFLWTGVDYLGESKRWPIINHSSGLLDRTGAVKPMAFERDSWWNDQSVLHLARRTAPDDRLPDDPGYGGEELHSQVQFADWTPRNTAPHQETVEAYSNCEEVELFLNGKSLGAQKINRDASPRVWKVPFTPGSLKAVGRNAKGKIVAKDELRTAGPANRIVLVTETKKLLPGFDQVAIVRARIVDANGVIVPRADDLITFEVVGPGFIAAVDNADPASTETFQSIRRRAYQGECVVYVKAVAGRGKINVSASTGRLSPGAVSIKVSK